MSPRCEYRRYRGWSGGLEDNSIIPRATPGVLPAGSSGQRGEELARRGVPEPVRLAARSLVRAGGRIFGVDPAGRASASQINCYIKHQFTPRPFPRYADIYLHIPISLVLVGITLRRCQGDGVIFVRWCPAGHTRMGPELPVNGQPTSLPSSQPSSCTNYFYELYLLPLHSFCSFLTQRADSIKN